MNIIKDKEIKIGRYYEDSFGNIIYLNAIELVKKYNEKSYKTILRYSIIKFVTNKGFLKNSFKSINNYSCTSTRFLLILKK